MLYNKPSNKKYTDMCKEFDTEFYSPDRDDNKLFAYLYLLYYMIAFQYGYFKSYQDYDNYSQQTATIVYIRYLKKWRNGERIKSVLNYVKSTANYMKITYQNNNFNEILDSEFADFDGDTFTDNLKATIQNDYVRNDKFEDIQLILDEVCNVLKNILDKSPYHKNKLMFDRIYYSCLLSFLSSITFNKKILVDLRGKRKMITDDEYLKLFNQQKQEDIILWHLPKEFKSYIRLLVNKLRYEVGIKIIDSEKDIELSDDVLESIISSAYDEYFKFEEEEYE